MPESYGNYYIVTKRYIEDRSRGSTSEEEEEGDLTGWRDRFFLVDAGEAVRVIDSDEILAKQCCAELTARWLAKGETRLGAYLSDEEDKLVLFPRHEAKLRRAYEIGRLAKLPVRRTYKAWKYRDFPVPPNGPAEFYTLLAEVATDWFYYIQTVEIPSP